MRTLSYIFLILVNLTTYAQTKKEYYENGNIKYSVSYHNGKQNDTSSWYYPNGIIESQMVFKNGMPWTIVTMNDSLGKSINGGTLYEGTGNLITYGLYASGIVYNAYETNNSKNIIKISNYKNGIKDGLTIEFFNYPNDTASKYNLKQEKYDGEYFRYYKQTGVKEIGSYIDGRLKKCKYLRNDSILTNPHFTLDSTKNIFKVSDTLCNGLYQIRCLPNINDYINQIALFNKFIDSFNGFQIPGYLTREIYFTNGKVDSIINFDYAYWGINSIIKMNYIDSIRTYINVSNNGIRWKYTFRIANDEEYIIKKKRYLMEGRFIEYFENGTIKSIVTYKNDELNGESIYYNENGIITKQENYINNILIK